MLAFILDLTFMEPLFSVRFVLFVTVLLIVLVVATRKSKHNRK